MIFSFLKALLHTMLYYCVLSCTLVYSVTLLMLNDLMFSFTICCTTVYYSVLCCTMLYEFIICCTSVCYLVLVCTLQYYVETTRTNNTTLKGHKGRWGWRGEGRAILGMELGSRMFRFIKKNKYGKM